MKRRAFCTSAAAAIGAAAFPLGRLFAAVSAVTADVAAVTGAGGLTLGGGFGRLARRFGLTCDQLTSVDIVTADGRLLQASATGNPVTGEFTAGIGGNNFLYSGRINFNQTS